VLDRGVVSIRIRHRRVGNDKDFNLLPPPADRPPEPAGFVLRDSFYQNLQAVFCDGRVGERAGGEQRPELLVDQPGGLQFPGSSLWFMVNLLP
jgi:hypothetical protein